jgi:aryl-alcohol dehydrogenase-like predicted oxidoreductase
VLNASAVHAGANGGGQDFEGAASLARELGQTSMGVRTVAGGALIASGYRSAIAGRVGDGGGLGGNPYANDLERAQRLIPIARKAGCEDIMEFGLRFAMSEPAIATSLIGFSDLDQVEVAIRAAERGPLVQAAIEAALAVARS